MLTCTEWLLAGLLAGIVYIVGFSDLIAGVLSRALVAELVGLWL